jgi:hypothetical protein
MMRAMNARSRRLRSLLLGASALLAVAPAVAQETVTYTYDLKGRLTGVSHAGGPAAGASASYTYDNADNRSNVTVTGATPPSFAIGNASSTEGSSLTFTVTRSGQSAGAYTMSYATRSGTATSGTDFNANSGTLPFADGQTSATITVSTIQDTAVEGNEAFYVDLSNASGGASITTATGTGTIVDDDAPPPCSGVSFTISSNGAVTEGGTSGFTVTKSGSTSSSCSVNYATASGTATSGSDFNAASGTLTFTSAQTSQTVNVTTIDDTAIESATETFTMSLSSPNNGATLGSPSSATATINDNDVAGPTVINLASGASTNLRTIANNNGYTGSSSANYQFVVGSGVTVTGSAGGWSGIDTGSWPAGVTLSLVINSSGIIRGGGGNGGNGGGWNGSTTVGATSGGAGGDAIICSAPIAITVNSGGTVQSGGGGGGGGGYATFTGPPGGGVVGGGGGGGGAPNGAGGTGGTGKNGGPTGANGAAGTTSGGGAGGGTGPTGGAGGTYGTAGSAGVTPSGGGAGGTGGAAGYAVRKNGTGCTVSNSGTVTGTVG